MDQVSTNCDGTSSTYELEDKFHIYRMIRHRMWNLLLHSVNGTYRTIFIAGIFQNKPILEDQFLNQDIYDKFVKLII